jgi:hypothetical protein
MNFLGKSQVSNGSDPQHYNELSASAVIPIEVDVVMISETQNIADGFRRDSEVYQDSYI